ncbi:MAG: 3'(2'),5'-bisphosphate nucleotidase CysQ [Gammaproteobacteria bacterium]|nr:3'(2'),5'-bisphosphate nucleotidase CysQ [Gammaproteobacteria bacterium]
MTTTEELARFAPDIIDLAGQAGAAILEIYEGGFDVETKADGSPLTMADQRSHKLIVSALAALTPDIPILSEESASISYAERVAWDRFWLVDPLDGTREFVKRNGEFTVNIALIEDRTPILGAVYTPVQRRCHYGYRGGGAFRVNGDGAAEPIQVRDYAGGRATVVASRSHARGSVQHFLERLRAAEGGYEVANMGSALKICLIAEGQGDIYPRLGPTSEWDTAAGQCVLECAGGKLVNCDGSPFVYNKESVLNPWFLAIGGGSYDWYKLLEGIEADD